jgi:hypothetical protein
MQNGSSSTVEHNPGDDPGSRTDERTPSVNAVPEQAETAEHAAHLTRRRIGRVLVVLASAVAMFASGWGMWTFFGDLPTIDDWYLILPMFLLFDLAAVACAWNARINRLAYGRMGIEGWLVWVFATLSGLMSASDADGRAAAVRFAAPMVAAILFELLIRGERRDITNQDGPLARIKRRTLARFGLLDDVDQDDEQAARTRMAARLATLAYRVHQHAEGTRGHRRAVTKYHRKLRVASERMQFATDAAMIADVRIHLDALYRSISGTSPDSVADLNVWRSTAPVESVAPESVDPVGDDVVEVEEDLSVPVTMGGPLKPRRTPSRRRVGRNLRRRQVRAGQPVAPPTDLVDPGTPDGAGRSGRRSAPASASAEVDLALATHGEELAQLARSTGDLTRYRVEQVTGLGRSRAQKVQELILAKVAADRDRDPVGAGV